MTVKQDVQRLMERVAELERRLVGPFRGFVVDNDDPEKRGRLRLLVPAVLGPEVTTGWAEPCVPCGGGGALGADAVPPVKKDGDGNPTTGVWVQFRGGDVSFPVWVGTFWGAPAGASEDSGSGADPVPGVDV